MASGITKPPELNGLVLMGGRSTRMGRDKSALVYHDKPQRAHVTELLRPYCRRVYWSVNNEQARTLTAPTQPLVIDAWPDAGPLGGIGSAFRTAPEAAWLVVACDLPLLTAHTLDVLLAGRTPTAPATAFAGPDGPEPLVCIWEPRARPALETALAAGRLSPRRLLLELGATWLTPPDPRELLNANDPDTGRALGGLP